MNAKQTKLTIISVLTLILIIWIIACAVNPVTGKRELMLMSESD